MVSTLLIELVRDSGGRVSPATADSAEDSLRAWEQNMGELTSTEEVRAAVERREESVTDADGFLNKLYASEPLDSSPKIKGLIHLRDLATAMLEIAKSELAARKGR
jgi:hypothetical protein